jgi:pyridoxal phosphate enzyme (YggS family)
MANIVGENLERVRSQMAEAMNRSGRTGTVTLIGVSKKQGREKLEAAYEAGLRDFGENRPQELAEHQQWLPDDVRWHMIGSLQRNKVRMVRPSVVLLHSLDRESLAQSWLKGSGKPPPVLVQVNVGNEPQKSGVSTADTRTLVEYARSIGVSVVGLMAIPPRVTSADEGAPYFAALRELRDSLVVGHPSVQHLSMGMSEDFQSAIAEGSTYIRVGRTIFGERNEQ